jgi:peptide/nickel transport system ATP-binding protein
MMTEPLKNLVDVKDLKTWFPIRAGVLSRTVGQVKAVDGVSFPSSPARRWGWSAKAAAARPPSGAR